MAHMYLHFLCAHYGLYLPSLDVKDEHCMVTRWQIAGSGAHQKAVRQRKRRNRACAGDRNALEDSGLLGDVPDKQPCVGGDIYTASASVDASTYGCVSI